MESITHDSVCFLYLQMCNSFLTVTHILPWYALNIFKPVLPRIELDSQGTSAGFWHSVKRGFGSGADAHSGWKLVYSDFQ